MRALKLYLLTIFALLVSLQTGLWADVSANAAWQDYGYRLTEHNLKIRENRFQHREENTLSDHFRPKNVIRTKGERHDTYFDVTPVFYTSIVFYARTPRSIFDVGQVVIISADGSADRLRGPPSNC